MSKKWDEIRAYHERYIFPQLKDKRNEFEKDEKGQSQLLKSIFVIASKDNNYVIPTEGNLILSEMSNGIIDYLGGKEGERIQYRDSIHKGSFFADWIWENYQSQIKKNPKKLTPKIKGLIDGLINSEWEYPCDASESYSYSRLCDIFEDCFSPPNLHASVFKIYESIINDCYKTIIPSFSKQEQENLEGIAKSTRKHIEEDMKYIKENGFKAFSQSDLRLINESWINKKIF